MSDDERDIDSDVSINLSGLDMKRMMQILTDSMLCFFSAMDRLTRGPIIMLWSENEETT